MLGVTIDAEWESRIKATNSRHKSVADLASAQLTLAQARGNHAAAMATLYQTLGLDRWTPIELVTPPVDAGEESAAPDVEAVLERRPEVRQIEQQERAYELLEGAVRGAHLPALSLSLGPSFQGADLGNLTPNLSVSVVLSYPGGYNPVLVSGQQREQEANRAVTREQARIVRNGVRLEIAQAEAALSSARESLVAATQLVAAARERRDLADARFGAGAGTLLELSDAEYQYVNARAQVIQAQVGLGIARARLSKATGGAIATR